MAKAEKAPKQRTRKQGKHTSGWEKVGLLLSPEVAKRLSLATIYQKSDRSTIVNDLLLAQLPTYVLSVRGASSTSVDMGAEQNLAVMNPV